MTNHVVECATEGALGWITINHPPANTLSAEVLTGICEAVERYDADTGVRTIAITGGGRRFFSAGAHLPALRDELVSPTQSGGLLSIGLHAMKSIEECGKPVIAVINGVAAGGGCELALACHLRLASTKATFCQPEIRLGLVPGWGGIHRLPRIIGDGRALDWILTGRTIGAQEAHAAGLVSRLVEPGSLRDKAAELGQKLASLPPVAIRVALRALRQRSLNPQQGEAFEAEAFAEVAKTFDAKEGVAAFFEKRQPEFTGA